MRDHMEYYDAALNDADCDFLLFLDSDAFFFDADWPSRRLKAFDDPKVAGISFVPRNGRPATFALCCRTSTYRALPPPVFACRYEFPEIWPHGVNLEGGDFAARELVKNGNIIVTVTSEEASQHVANFRSSTALRATRENIIRVAGEPAFARCVAQHRPYSVPAYDNVLLGSLYQALFGEPFAADSAGTHLGGSVTVADLTRALQDIRDMEQIDRLRTRFQQSVQSILRMAEREGVELSIPSVLPTPAAESIGQ